MSKHDSWVPLPNIRLHIDHLGIAYDDAAYEAGIIIFIGLTKCDDSEDMAFSGLVDCCEGIVEDRNVPINLDQATIVNQTLSSEGARKRVVDSLKDKLTNRIGQTPRTGQQMVDDAISIARTTLMALFESMNVFNEHLFEDDRLHKRSNAKLEKVKRYVRIDAHLNTAESDYSNGKVCSAEYETFRVVE